MSNEAAFLAAIRAAPGDDAPRLVFADWFEDNGRPERAEFIRVQLELANATAAADRHCDLVEREAELEMILADELAAEWPQLPNGWQRGARRRGFPEEVVVHGRFLPAATEGLAAQLRAVSLEMPLTGLDLASTPGPQWNVLGDPVCERLRSLRCSGDPEVVGLLCGARHLGGLRHLDVSMSAGSPLLARLLKARSLPSLRSFRFTFFDLKRAERPLFTAATFRKQLVELAAMHGCFGLYPSLAAGCAFPALRRFEYFGELTTELAALLNDEALYPALDTVEIEGASLPRGRPGRLERPLRHVRRESHSVAWLRELLASPGLRAVRVLDLQDSSPGTEGLQTLARSGPFDGLRHLRLSHQSCAPEGLRALAPASFWRTVTSFELSRGYAEGDGAGWAAFFGALDAPALRHLSLVGAKIRSKGALALARNRSLAGLRFLRIVGQLRKQAVRAILTAPQFQGLLVLVMSETDGREAFEVLADPAVLPKARRIVLREKVPPAIAERLRARPEVVLR
jgi:uncharacterized protein (TIGR02996 family)